MNRFRGPKRSILRLFVCATSAVIAFLPSAFGARPARVNSEVTPLLSEPREGAEVLEELRKGRALAASNYPVDGFHKVRTATGVVGWVSPLDLVLFDIPEGASEDAALDAAGDQGNGATHKSVFFRGLGGMGIFKMAQVNEQFGLGGLRYGIHGGVEVSYAFSRWFGLTFRAEGLGKVFVMTDDGSNKSYQVSMYSYPVLAGADLRLVDARHFKLSLGGFAGAGLYSQLVSQALSEATPNETALQGTAFAGMARLGIDIPIWSWLGLSFEGGYRYQPSGALTPLVAGNGDEIFDDANGERVPLVLDFSGPFVSAGVVFLF